MWCYALSIRHDGNLIFIEIMPACPEFGDGDWRAVLHCSGGLDSQIPTHYH